MKQFAKWKYAFIIGSRNFMRGSHRSVLSVFIISMGVVGIIVSISFIERVFKGVRESTINSQTGHIQLVHKGFLENRTSDPYSYLIDNYDEVKKALHNLHHIRVITKRQEFSGIVGNGQNSTIFSGVGVEQQSDGLISTFDRIVSGEDLADFDDSCGTIGVGLARSLHIKTGQQLMVMSMMGNGAINAVDMQVRGLLESDVVEYNDRILKMPFSLSQKLLNTQSVSRIVLLLDDTDKTFDVKNKIVNLVQANNWNFDVLDWNFLNPSYNKIVLLYKRIFGFISITIALLITLSVSNTIMMNFMERKRECGLMRAIGANKGFILRVFWIESTFYGIVGSFVGVVCSLSLFWVINSAFGGIQMSAPPGSSRPVTFILHGSTPEALIVCCVTVILTLISSFVVINKIGNMNIVNAIRSSK